MLGLQLAATACISGDSGARTECSCVASEALLFTTAVMALLSVLSTIDATQPQRRPLEIVTSGRDGLLTHVYSVSTSVALAADLCASPPRRDACATKRLAIFADGRRSTVPKEGISCP